MAAEKSHASRSADRRAQVLRSGAVREYHLVIADPKSIAFEDRLPANSLPFELDPVGRSEVDDVEAPRHELDHGVLPRDVRIPDREVAGVPDAADDEPLLG